MWFGLGSYSDDKKNEFKFVNIRERLEPLFLDRRWRITVGSGLISRSNIEIMVQIRHYRWWI